MAICALLSQKVDERKNGVDCCFNGYLEDYLNFEVDNLPSDLSESFHSILEEFPDMKVCVQLRSSIKTETISNQIIRYKDIFKLEGNPIVYPYLFYRQEEDEERALLVCDEPQFSYLFAKGLFYCMSESGAEFSSCKNELVAVGLDSEVNFPELIHQLFREKCGALQRKLDRQHFHNYSELQNDAYLAANQLKMEAPLVLEDLEDRADRIKYYVTHWFLLKKVLYVQYMVNKNLLNTLHDGEIKKQRAQAKKNADEVVFISYCDLWRTAKHRESNPL